MNQEPHSAYPSIQLPREFVDRFRKPFTRFVQIQTMGGAALLLSAIAALVLSNSAVADFYFAFWEMPAGLQLGEWEYVRSLKHWINDGLMTLFFFIVALELKREWVLGELSNPRLAALSIFAALGGMLVPAAIYLVLQWNQPGQSGWGTVMATDTAFVIGCLALLGQHVPKSLRVFMLSLAIVDDIGAVLIVAIGYSSQIHWGALVAAALGLLLVRTMAWGGVRGFPVYFLVGSFIWLAVDASGIHATVTGVALGLMTPARRWVTDKRLYSILGQVIAHPTHHEHSGDTKDRETLKIAEVAVRETLSPVERLQMGLHPWVGFLVMPLFALANAGLPLRIESFASSITLAVFLGFAVGKPLGVFLFSWLAVRAGIAAKPLELGWGFIAGGSLLAGIGFTMALFIADRAFDEATVDSAKSGIFLASLFAAAVGVGFLRWWSSRAVKYR